MRDTHGSSHDGIEREKRFLEKLRRHPELLERFEAILGLSETRDGPLRSADETEEMLIDEVRRLGSRVMHDWAAATEECAAVQMRREHPRARLKKKAP
jgi:hypothetical protein